MRRPVIGVLALQGAFALHEPHIVGAGGDFHPVVGKHDLAEVDALILPGGESGVMLKLLATLQLHAPLHEFVSRRPTWGICAGAILLANQVSNPTQDSLRVFDVEIVRNGYGRQIDSLEETIDDYRVAYIRAPRVARVGPEVEVRHCRGSDPTWLEWRHLTLTVFHPELNPEAPSPWHRRLVAMASQTSANSC